MQLMFNLVSRQGYSLAAVCRELARRGIKTPKGNGKWSPSTVRDILLNPAYSGQARYGKQRLVPRKAGKRTKRGDPLVPRRAKVTEDTDLQDQVVIAVPAIVDGLMFSQAKERMDENRKRQRQRQEGAALLLSGLLICGECGSAYCGHLHRTRRNYFYYRCVGAEKHRYESEAICSNGSVKGYELEDYVWSNACELLRDPARLELELNRRQNESLSPESKCVELDQRIHGINDRMSRLIDAYESGLLTKPEFASRIEPLREEHDRELATLRSLRGQIADAHDPAAASELLRQFTESVGSKLSTASQPLKRQILQLLIRRIEIHRDEVRVVYKVPQNPFHQGPDNRGFLPHRLLCALTTSWSPRLRASAGPTSRRKPIRLAASVADTSASCPVRRRLLPKWSENPRKLRREPSDRTPFGRCSLPHAGRRVTSRVNGRNRTLAVADKLQRLSYVGPEVNRAAKRHAESTSERRDLPSSPVVDSNEQPQL